MQVSVGVEVSLVKWLMSKLRSLMKGEGPLGFQESRKGKEMDLTMNVKENKNEIFLSLLVVSSFFSKGFKSICIPRGSNFTGGKLFLSALEWTLNISPRVSTVEIQRKQVVEKMVVDPVSHATVEELRNELIIMSSLWVVMCWEVIREDL